MFIPNHLKMRIQILSNKSIAFINNTTTALSYLTSRCNFNDQFNNLIFSKNENIDEDDKYRLYKGLRHLRYGNF
jgi:hypothetical protein